MGSDILVGPFPFTTLGVVGADDLELLDQFPGEQVRNLLAFLGPFVALFAPVRLLVHLVDLFKA